MGALDCYKSSQTAARHTWLLLLLLLLRKGHPRRQDKCLGWRVAGKGRLLSRICQAEASLCQLDHLHTARSNHGLVIEVALNLLVGDVQALPAKKLCLLDMSCSEECEWIGGFHEGECRQPYYAASGLLLALTMHLCSSTPVQQP